MLSLLLLSIFAVSLTLLIIYILNPDKAPLPWQAYCSLPATTTSLYSSEIEQLSAVPNVSPISPSSAPSYKSYPFAGILPYSPSPPSPPLETLPPVGVFAAVFTVDSAFERRMLIRTTWASHSRSRDGAGQGDGGRGTSRTIVRFIMGTPRPEWERRISAEMQMYNDIVILPITESMNKGKTHTFFSWSALDAWVPPIYPAALREDGFPEGQAQNRTFVQPLRTSYSNFTSVPPPLAPHDPTWAFLDAERAASQSRAGSDALGSVIERESMMRWVRPDYVIKIDDDSFVMLAELESRLRTELYAGTTIIDNRRAEDSSEVTPPSNQTVVEQPPSTPSSSSSSAEGYHDPLIYWGYLVKNRYHTFMAGEMYALSWPLVDWVSKSPEVKGLTKGAEDKQTSKWIKLYPGSSSGLGENHLERRREVRWVSERCWIYDHPRASTVYAHGFLFPTEAAKIKEKLQSFFDFSSFGKSSGTSATTVESPQPPPQATPALDIPPAGALSTGLHPFSSAFSSISSGLGLPLNLSGTPGELYETPESWAASTVSVFRQRYSPPLPALSFPHSVEALIEGSAMSLLKEEGSPMSPEFAWKHREGRGTQYQGNRVGGTICIHFIKKNLWYFETALAMLEGEEVTEGELEEERGRLLKERESSAGLVSEESGLPARSNQLWKTTHTRRAKLRSGLNTW